MHDFVQAGVRYGDRSSLCQAERESEVPFLPPDIRFAQQNQYAKGFPLIQEWHG
jgi:hypothetical protein